MGKWLARLASLGAEKTAYPLPPSLTKLSEGGFWQFCQWAGRGVQKKFLLRSTAMPRIPRARERLLRWGWPAPEAEAMAERLAWRDREADDRVSCAGDCAHYRPGRCGNHKRAGLHTAELGRDLAGLLQRCPGFQSEG